MYTNREINNCACKSIVLTCLEMLFVRLVYINDLIICCSYCFTIYNNSNNNKNNDDDDDDDDDDDHHHHHHHHHYHFCRVGYIEI